MGKLLIAKATNIVKAEDCEVVYCIVATHTAFTNFLNTFTVIGFN